MKQSPTFWVSLILIVYLSLSLATEGEFLPNPLDFMFDNWFQSGIVTVVLIIVLIPVCIKTRRK